MNSELKTLSKEQRYETHRQLNKMFPECNINIPSTKYVVNKNKWYHFRPFNLETGEMAYGDYKGKTLDQVFKENPAYIMRMTYYAAFHWEPLHKLHFIKWTKELDTRN